MPWEDHHNQPLVCELLRRSLSNDRMHHGYIFIGADSETLPVAMTLAQSLNCERKDGTPCGKCFSCLAIAREGHPDIPVVKPESKSRRIVIKQIRELERSVFLKPSHARTKVAIIHAADRLNPEAQDAFLKTLEEPPSRTIFLLLTEDPGQLKDTILSRCLRVPFRPPQNLQLSSHEEQVLKWLEAFSEIPSGRSPMFYAYGIVGQILGMLKEIRDLKLEEALASLDDPSYDHMDATLRERLEEQMQAIAQSEYVRERTRLLKTMVEWYHQRESPPEVIETLQNLSDQLGRNVNENLAWEMAFLDLATASRR